MDLKRCSFCMKSGGLSGVKEEWDPDALLYKCPRCGPICISKSTEGIVRGDDLTQKEKNIVSIVLRSRSEEREPKGSYGEKLEMTDLRRLIETYRERDAVERMDNALLLFGKRLRNIGDSFRMDYQNDYPFYHCFEPGELVRIIEFLHDNNLIKSEGVKFGVNAGIYISSKGYERLREIKKVGIDSRQCFVAMWFGEDMDTVYEKAIKPAIEYKEEGQTESRFKAINIGKKEHTNDINDEIISEIRRSRFMVCDLTGYRGGVYWEAGFAYGLGLEVIYTCREDWIKTEELDLYYKDGKKTKYKKEGIHFDLEHRNRIAWKTDDPTFKDNLINRIKAVIT